MPERDLAGCRRRDDAAPADWAFTWLEHDRGAELTRAVGHLADLGDFDVWQPQRPLSGALHDAACESAAKLERQVRAAAEPYPDETLALEDGYTAPQARYEQRECVELAFIAALQLGGPIGGGTGVGLQTPSANAHCSPIGCELGWWLRGLTGEPGSIALLLRGSTGSAR